MSNSVESNKSLYSKASIFLYVFFVICIVLIFYLFSSPYNSNNDNSIIHVSSNQNLSSISKELKNQKIIRSEFFLKAFVLIFNSDKRINQGDYMFGKRAPVFSVAWQLSKGKHKIDPIRVTFREGLTNEEMALILETKLLNFNKELFLEQSIDKQGYLFPDTYFFFPMDSTVEIIDRLSKNFINKTNKIKNLFSASKKSKEEIIIMASIIQKEANGEEDVYLISGILWKRLELGMPLQVDASPITYEIKGLPDSPICNPGILSIKAAIKPISSSYLYYLHDKNGKIYFAQSYEEHKNNINKFLR